jgi:hypothetical protein
MAKRLRCSEDQFTPAHRSLDDLRGMLLSLGLDTRGDQNACRARLLAHHAPKRHCSSKSPRVPFQVFVRCQRGTLTISCPDGGRTAVEHLQHEIAERDRVPVSLQCLIYNGKRLDPKAAFADCDISADANLQLIVRAVGGGGHCRAVPTSWPLSVRGGRTG